MFMISENSIVYMNIYNRLQETTFFSKNISHILSINNIFINNTFSTSNIYLLKSFLYVFTLKALCTYEKPVKTVKTSM